MGRGVYVEHIYGDVDITIDSRTKHPLSWRHVVWTIRRGFTAFYLGEWGCIQVDHVGQ